MDNYNNMPNGSYGNFYGEAEKAPNIFQQFAYAFVPPKYRSLAKVKTGSMIAFVTVLVLVFALASLAKFAVSFFAMGDMEAILDEIPDFELSGGVFSIEEPYVLDEGDSFIWVTDEVYEFDYDDIRYLVNEEGYNQVVLIAQKGIYLYNNREYQELMFDDIRNVTFNKDWIANTLMPLIGVGVVIGYLLGFVFGTLWYFGCAAIYLLIAMLIAAIMSRKLPAGGLFRAAVYSKVFMYVIVKVLGLLPLAVSIPFWIRVLLTIVFLCFAVRFIEEPQPAAPGGYGGYNGYIQ